MKPKILAYSCLGLALGVGAFTLFDRTIPPIPAKSTKQKKLTREPVSTNSIEAAIVPTADQNYTLAWSIEWLSRYPQANIAEPTADDDNDGVNNYQEMLAGTNPGKAQASDDHAATLVHMSHSSPSVEEVSDNLKALAATAKREQPERERVLLERAKTFGIEVKRSQDGKIIHPFAISENGEIFRGTTLDVIAADTVGADELWPTPLWPIGGTTFPNFAHGSSGLNLTGAGQRIGMWEDWADLEFGGTIAGIDIDHGLFGTRMTQGEEDTDFNFIPDDFDVDSIQDFDVPDSNHASAVAGVMAGTGVSAFFGNYNFGEQARGIAYNSTVLAHERDGYDYEFPALADPLSANAITLANNSRGIASGWISDGAGGWKWFGNSTSTAVEDWRFGAYAGPSLFGGYDYFPSGLDNMANSAPYTLQVFSAGNSRNDGPTTLPASYLLGDGPTTSTFARDLTNGDDGGYDSLLPSSVAKNILTVGSCRDSVNGNLSTSTEPVYSSFSSAGPTDDGRIKPEVVAPGEILDTSRSLGYTVAQSGNSVDFLNGQKGTSLSAPVVTGGLALVQERRAQLRPAWVVPTFTWPLQSSTLRMLAVHTARDLGSAGPDYRGGYGLFNALAAVTAMGTDAASDYKPFIKEMQIGNAEFVQFQVTATSATEALKVTIAWTDPTGAAQTNNSVDQTTARLRNDFDLRVYPPGTPSNELLLLNSTFAVRPWVLNPDFPNKTAAARAAAAIKGDDTRNNLEQVVISNPVAGGIYTVRVTHKGNLFNSAPQWVSMGISGRVIPPSHNFAISNFVQINGTWNVTWNSIPGGVYKVEGSTNLVNWVTLTGDLSSRSDSMQAAFQTPTSSSYFFRVRRYY